MLSSALRSCVVALALATSAGSACAADWNLFTKEGGETQLWFFDAATVEKEGSMVRVWIKNYRMKEPDKDGAWIIATRQEFNCTKRTVQYVMASDYDQKGNFLRSWPTATAVEPVAPDSVAEYLMGVICKKEFPQLRADVPYEKVAQNNPQAYYENYVKRFNPKFDPAPR